MTRTLALFILGFALTACGISKESKTTDPAPVAPPAPISPEGLCSQQVIESHRRLKDRMNSKKSQIDPLESLVSACGEFETLIRSKSCEYDDEVRRQRLTLSFDDQIQSTCRSAENELNDLRRGAPAQSQPNAPTSAVPAAEPEKEPAKEPLLPAAPAPAAPAPVAPTPAAPSIPAPSTTPPARPTEPIPHAVDALKRLQEITWKIVNADLLKSATVKEFIAEKALFKGKLLRQIDMVRALDRGEVGCFLFDRKMSFRKDETFASFKIETDAADSQAHRDVTMYVKFSDGRVGALTCTRRGLAPTPKQVREALQGVLEIVSFR